MPGARAYSLHGSVRAELKSAKKIQAYHFNPCRRDACAPGDESPSLSGVNLMPLPFQDFYFVYYVEFPIFNILACLEDKHPRGFNALASAKSIAVQGWMKRKGAK